MQETPKDSNSDSVSSPVAAGYVADKPYGWAVEYEPGKYLTDDDTTTCVWRSKAKAEQQARWQKDFDDAWNGIRVVPVFIGNPAT